MDVAYRLSDHLALCRYEDLPNSTVETTKKFALDALGAAMAGTTAVGCSQVVKRIKYWGGRKEGSIFVYGGKVPVYHAAFLNSMFCHARELDDGHEDGSIHTFSTVLPAALAVAEQKGHVSGKEFLAALAIGVDLAARLALSMRYMRGWHYTGFCGTFAAAAAAGRIMGFDPDKMRQTLGIAYTQTAGVGIGSTEATMTKRLNPAIASRSGVMAAYLASDGVTGPNNIFESKEGLFRMFDGDYHDEQALRYKVDGSLYTRETLTADLGKKFEVDNLYMKPFPSCRFTHAPIQATLNIVRAKNIPPESISAVRVYVCKRTMKYGGPFEGGDYPEIKAQFNIPYLIAAAIMRKKVFLDSLDRESVRDPAVLELAKKVQVIHDPAIKLKVPVTVEIDTISGDRYRERVDQIKGNAVSPLTEEERREKFLNCSDYSARPFTKEALNQLIEIVEDLEGLEDVKMLAAKMSPTA